ncbi:MAG: amidohydrolase family protein [Terriglobia bacterium]
MGAGRNVPSRSRVDVHHHFVPQVWARELRSGIAETTRNPALLFDWTPDRSLDALDRSATGTAFLSLTSPGLGPVPLPDERRLARACNEYAADLVRDHPGRFGAFAILPLQDIDAGIEEAVYALDILKLDGIGLMTSHHGKWPGDASFAPLFEELNRRHAVVYLHPTVSSCTAAIPDVSPSVIEFPIETARAVASLLFGGTLAGCPSIKWIFSHGGGALPALAERMTRLFDSQSRLRLRAPAGALAELQRLYYDTAQATAPAALNALLSFVPVSQILFGSDYPMLPIGNAVEGLARLGLSAATLEAIERGNAQAVFARLGASGNAA